MRYLLPINEAGKQGTLSTQWSNHRNPEKSPNGTPIIIPFHDWMLQRDVRGLHPTFNAEALTQAEIKRWSGWDSHRIIPVIEVQCLAHFPCGEFRVTEEERFVSPLHALSVSIKG